MSSPHLRPFSLFSWSDYQSLRSILATDGAKHFMVNNKPLSILAYGKWLMDNSLTFKLYAVCLQSNHPIGFVYFYWGKEEQETLHRLQETKVSLPPCNTYVEVSFAKNEGKFPKNIMTQAVKAACRNIKQEYESHHQQKLAILAYIDPQNKKAIRLVEQSGFRQVGAVAYQPSSPHKDLVYHYLF
jgi:RimJ/RimL family protein N-acetyltransferase